MKKLVKVEEVENEGLVSFMGSRIFIIAESFFYEGELVGVNDTFVKLDDAYFVLESGAFTGDKVEYAEKLKGPAYVQRDKIESYFLSHRK